ncbi:hypothetical protein J6590_073612 [Homalodisca vitripennis]|nr:hypothetical protein J6590_073612 [Homalodisca vitripennis]
MPVLIIVDRMIYHDYKRLTVDKAVALRLLPSRKHLNRLETSGIVEAKYRITTAFIEIVDEEDP